MKKTLIILLIAVLLSGCATIGTPKSPLRNYDENGFPIPNTYYKWSEEKALKIQTNVLQQNTPSYNTK